MTNTTKDPQIAKTIVEQLGNLTLSMLGAQSLVDLGSGLQFRCRGSRRVNCIRIELDIGRDLYNVKFYKIGRAPEYRITEAGSFDGVGVEQLHSLIESATGLRTRM